MASSIIEEDLTIEGDLNSSAGGIEVKGRVVGDVRAETITVQIGGSVDGALSANKIVIEGKQKGSLKCDNLKIASSAQIQADVSAKTMATESGARVVGKVNIAGGQQGMPDGKIG
ncbi:Polymer-forming cytoskeletal [Ruegeria denitrificans]|uniref:Polymer-forming cytoskeletal n=1 Tax=Ruegeria denitrificans TaxID=1715692 RepID=A0A0P1IKR5_9RHOB|nr:polymer-forming cytoskeletal protein [Ruegeria denitrificans]CUK20712.1 Polymer-forming cytoskeletal [Ruegeria denitrificans]